MKFFLCFDYDISRTVVIHIQIGFASYLLPRVLLIPLCIIFEPYNSLVWQYPTFLIIASMIPRLHKRKLVQTGDGQLGQSYIVWKWKW